MGFWSDLFGAGRSASPRAGIQSDGPGVLISTPQQLEEALRHGNLASSGEAVTADSALRVAAVFGCVRARCTGPATLPIDIKRRVDERTRADASDHRTWELLRRRPNAWQKPHQFKRMLQAQVLLRGNGYALKVPGVRGVQALIPMNPDRVRTKQLDDLSIVHEWTRRDGRRVTLQQDQVFHLFGLTLDGITGVTPITYAREAIGTSLSMDRYVGRTMAKGARVSGALQKKEGALSDPAYERIKASLEEFRAGEDREGSFLLLEEGLEWKAMSLTMVDMQWIESQRLSRSTICMYFGVPPSEIGDNSGSDSNWGTGLEQKRQGFLSSTVEDDLVMWEEGINGDLIGEPDVFARFNRSAFVRADLKSRNASYTAGRNGGWLSKNDIRSMEDMNPIDGGDDYDAPLNSNSAPASNKDDDDDDDAAPSRQR